MNEEFDELLEIWSEVGSYNGNLTDPEIDWPMGFGTVFTVLHEPQFLGVVPKPGDQMHHNCLACNLDQDFGYIIKFLNETRKPFSDKDHIRYTFSIFIQLMNNCVEKMIAVLKVIHIKDYLTKWPVLWEIKRWTNFIKHPKLFLYTHHPEFLFNDQLYNEPNNNTSDILAYPFVSDFFTNEKFEIAQLKSKVQNRGGLTVVLPNLVRVSKEYIFFCYQVLQLIEQSPDYKNDLRNISTLENFC